MPTYEFLCEVCGPFEQRRNIQEASDPMACPTCLVTAQRIYSTAGFILTSGTLRRRIEQSAEPNVVTRPKPEEPPSPPRLHQAVHRSETPSGWGKAVLRRKPGNPEGY